MLSCEGNAERRWKTTIGLKKATFARAHFFSTFLCRCFAWLQRETSRNFFEGNVARVLVHFFFLLPLMFTGLPLVATSISHVVTAAITKFSCRSSNKKVSFVFFISRSRSLSPFLSLSFAGVPPTFSISLSFSCSAIFQICGHAN